MDVKELLINKGIYPLSRSRDYVITCLNPDHDDKHPSLRIDKLTGIFHCVSCGFSGNIFHYFGIKNNKLIDIRALQLQEKIQKLLKVKTFSLPIDAVPYNRKFRNINPETYMYFSAFLSESLMPGRLIIPIKDILGNIVGFQGRYIYSDIEPKYQYLPENSTIPLFPAIIEPIDGSIILVEGIFDMLNLWDKGLKNVVCTFGTAFGNTKKAEKQKRNKERLIPYRYQGVNKIYIMYDGDKAGKSAANNLKEYLDDSYITETIDLEEGMDPGAFTTEDVTRLKGILYE